MQSAYRKNYSTKTAILQIYNDILRAMDNGECTILVMLYLSAAFDTVDHPILIKRLYNTFGIQGKSLDWIKSYLLNRTQQICIQNLLSDTKILKYNVPQGSILGPDFYSDFTEPVRDIVWASSVVPHFYADDSQLYVHFKADSQTIKSALNKMEICCDNVLTWMCANLFKINQEKTEVLILGVKPCLKKIDVEGIKIGECYIKPGDKVWMMNEWMNEKFIHAFISKNRPKSAETEQNDKFSNKIRKS